MPVRNPIQQIVDEQLRREVRTTTVPIITLNSKPGGKALAKGFPGTVHIILARRGTGLVQKVQAALNSGEEDFTQVITQIGAPYRKKKSPLTIDTMAKLTVKQPVFAELRSGGERLHSGLFVPPGAEAIPLAYPYNGGPVPARGLELVEYVAAGAGEGGFEAVALKCNPVLTAAETAAVKAVPSAQAGLNIGAARDCDTTYLLVAALAVAAGTLAIALLTGTCGVALDPHLGEEEIQKLGPGASARTLLEMRRNALAKAMAQLGKRR
jgi:hypothetical protein